MAMVEVLLAPSDAVGKLSSVCKMELDAFQKGRVERIMYNYRSLLTSKRHPPGRMWEVLETDWQCELAQVR